MKVRAIRRSKLLNQFITDNKLKLENTRIANQNVELFNLLKKRNDAGEMLDRFLQNLSHEWYNETGIDIPRLKDDLYKIRNYTWGGDQNNSLDKHLISRYVKVISDYSELQGKKGEIAENSWNYVQNSWYNNWTSFLIESLFKQNSKVISAVGEIKSVDFFIGGFPLDLKVTFFPNGFMDKKIATKLGGSVLSWLKEEGKRSGITTNRQPTKEQQIYTLTEELRAHGRFDIISKLRDTRREIIHEARRNPVELMTWLYENQGELRFGAENRIYLILADTEDYEQSWKMKRAFSLIEPKVADYIDRFSPSSLKEIHFSYKNIEYSSLADSIFVINEID